MKEHKNKRPVLSYFLVVLGLILVFSLFVFGDLFNLSGFSQLIESFFGLQSALLVFIVLSVLILAILVVPILLVVVAMVFEFLFSKIGFRFNLSGKIAAAFRKMLSFSDSSFFSRKIGPFVMGVLKEVKLVAYAFLFAYVFDLLFLFPGLLFPFLEPRTYSSCAMRILINPFISGSVPIQSFCSGGVLLLFFCLILVNGLDGLGKLKWLDAIFSRNLKS